MYEPKTTQKTYRDGTRTEVTSDGVQKSEHIWLPGNETTDANAVIWTDKHRKTVSIATAGGIRTEDSVLPHQTKAQIFTKFRRAVMSGDWV